MGICFSERIIENFKKGEFYIQEELFTEPYG